MRRPLLKLMGNDRLLRAFGLGIATPDAPMQTPARMLDTPAIQVPLAERKNKNLCRVSAIDLLCFKCAKAASHLPDVSTTLVDLILPRIRCCARHQYGANAVVQIDAGTGDWGRASGALRFVDPAQNRAVRCSLLSFAPAHEVPLEEAAEFFKNQLDMCKRKGLNVTVAPGGVRAVALDARALASVEAIFKADKCDLLFVLLPGRKTPFYDALKCDTETRLGVLSQCFLGAKVRGAKPMYHANVSLKICAKLGGTCHQLRADALAPLFARLGGGAPGGSVMLVGCDVYHPPPFSASPSVAAVVASYDAALSKYATETSFQTGRVEMILGMERCMSALLANYQTHNKGALPAHIVITRDGVGEGQFDLVLTHEVGAIRAAALKLRAGYRPLITCVNVQKRHHAVFFPVRREDGDRNGNPKAGTCVDSVVVDPREADFYLYGHAALVGCSRAAHHNVLLNEGQFTLVDLERLLFYLSHLYQRCPKSGTLARQCRPFQTHHHLTYFTFLCATNTLKNFGSNISTTIYVYA